MDKIIHQKKMLFFISIIISSLLGLCLYLHSNILIINPTYKSAIVGIIDDSVHNDSLILSLNKINSNIKEQPTHGDALMDFISVYSPNAQIYYYDATDDNGNITDNSIISGLEWMKENNIYHINISLSSKQYSQKLQNYINENVNNFLITSSFNNQKNTFDYPAMYINVEGVGVTNKTNTDFVSSGYRTNKIIVNSKNKKFFQGNSFLALYEAINKSIKHSITYELKGDVTP